MKTIIATSVIAMISAGVYGFIDLSNDLNSGTMVQYAHEGEQPAREDALAEAFAISSVTREVQMKSAGRSVANNAVKDVPKKEKKVRVETFTIDLSEFSRGMPMSKYEEIRKIKEERRAKKEAEALVLEAGTDSILIDTEEAPIELATEAEEKKE